MPEMTIRPSRRTNVAEPWAVSRLVALLMRALVGPQQ
jgi:hypothetical protein